MTSAQSQSKRQALLGTLRKPHCKWRDGRAQQRSFSCLVSGQTDILYLRLEKHAFFRWGHSSLRASFRGTVPLPVEAFMPILVQPHRNPQDRVMYLIKKIIGFFVTPLAFCSVIQIIGLWFIFGNKKKVGIILCASGMGLLLVLSTPAVGEKLMGALETHQDASPRLQPEELNEDAAFVVVLSGGFHKPTQYSPATRLAPDTLRRLIEGMALCTRLPEAKLLLSGGVLTGEEMPATVMAELALSLGWEPTRLILETEAKTTSEQATRIKDLIGEAEFYLVTSANHIPRAMEHFEAAGTHPTAYPCDQIIQTPTLGVGSLIPSIYGLALSNAALHEYLGRIYGWLTK